MFDDRGASGILLGKEWDLMQWWEHGIIYQIYPRSYQDTNGDGIGDIKGILQRLDYIHSLGVDGIWLSPIFPSPMADFGYDVSNYTAIDPLFGSMDDLDLLLKEAHGKGLKVILDLVLNHTSNEHPWFLQSRSSKDNDKSDFYIWSDTIPNNWYAAFGGKGWTYDSLRQQYYFHSFLPQQPDLNWRNPKTVDAIFKEIAFWLDKGVDGFRLDVINLIIKDESLRSNPKIVGTRPRPYDMQRHIFDRNRPELHDRLRALRKLLDSYQERMLVGEIMVEMPGEPELAASYLGRNKDELNLTFDFSLIYTSFNAVKWQRAAKRWYEAVGRHRVPTWVLNNHDVERSVSRFKGDERKAKLAALFLLTQRGSIFLYYGEELGLPNSTVSRSQIQDPVGIKYWPFHPSRDRARGPMVWTVGEGKGFSDAESWLPFAKGANRYSVENQSLEPDSMLWYYRNLIKLRNDDPVLQDGICTFLQTSNQQIIAYLREHEQEGKRLVVLSFSQKVQKVLIAGVLLNPFGCKRLFSTHEEQEFSSSASNAMVLQPFQGSVFALDV